MMERLSLVSLALGFGTACVVLGASGAGHGKPYKGGELYSSQAYHYGRVEVRMRMARGSGLLSTFFTYKNGSELEDTFWEEIDVEVLGKDDATCWQSNIITGLGSRVTSEQLHPHPFSLADDYHTYVLEWAPDYVAWELDGVLLRRTTGAQVSELANPQSLRFNIWAASSVEWVGPFDAAVLPAYQYVNWIKYSRYEGGQFTHEWTDDFDTFDATRWASADWSFAENLADFDTNNVVVQDGTLILALTHEGETGFYGTVPPDNGENTGGASGSGFGGSGDGTGGTAAGGTAAGGTAAGGTAAGGTAAGGTAAGGTAAGGTAAGAAQSGGAGLGGSAVGGTGNDSAAGAAQSAGAAGPGSGGALGNSGTPATGGAQLGSGGATIGSSAGGAAAGGTAAAALGGGMGTGGSNVAGGAGREGGFGYTGGAAPDASSGPTDAESDAEGCACRTAGGHPPSGAPTSPWVVGVAALGVSLRRRRQR